jgi:hypothetical protein
MEADQMKALSKEGNFSFRDIAIQDMKTISSWK